MKNSQIVFTKINTAELLDVEYREPVGNEVLVKTHFSTISCGTERANITGDPNIAAAGPSQVVFPRYCGYSNSGEVIAVGKDVTSLKVGDKIASIGGFHKKYNILKEEYAIKFDDTKIPMEYAALSYISIFPLASIRKTRLEIGESALVMGLGILGQFAVKFLKTAGAVPIIVADPIEERRQEALQSGADYAFNPFDEDFAKKVKEVSQGGVKVAIEVTGVGAGFDSALDCMAPFGRVALLGCTRDKNFEIDYYKKIHFPGITIIGAHNQARPMNDSYPGFFTMQDDMRTMHKLLSGGRLNLDGIIAETHTPEECGEVFTRLVNDRHFPTVVQFDWRNA